MDQFRGRFCWVELMAGDCAVAADFYAGLMGWGTRAAPVAGKAYTLFTHAGRPVAGLMEQPETRRSLGLPPAWMGHVAVADVDSATALAESLGGTIRVPGTDIPEVGRFAVISDPHGAALGLFRPDCAAEPPDGPDQPGGVCWRELGAPDGPAAFDFYHRLLGWEKAELLDMGPAGAYQLIAVDGQPFGGIATRPAPAWLFYFGVADIDAAATRATASGARLAGPPMAVPGGGWIVQGTDPQGAAFALHGARAAGRG